MKLLLDHGADPNLPFGNYETCVLDSKTHFYASDKYLGALSTLPSGLETPILFVVFLAPAPISIIRIPEHGLPSPTCGIQIALPPLAPKKSLESACLRTFRHGMRPTREGGPHATALAPMERVRIYIICIIRAGTCVAIPRIIFGVP